MPEGRKRKISDKTVVSTVPKTNVQVSKVREKALKIRVNLFYGAKMHDGIFFLRLYYVFKCCAKVF